MGVLNHIPGIKDILNNFKIKNEYKRNNGILEIAKTLSKAGFRLNKKDPVEALRKSRNTVKELKNEKQEKEKEWDASLDKEHSLKQENKEIRKKIPFLIRPSGLPPVFSLINAPRYFFRGVSTLFLKAGSVIPEKFPGIGGIGTGSREILSLIKKYNDNKTTITKEKVKREELYLEIKNNYKLEEAKDELKEFEKELEDFNKERKEDIECCLYYEQHKYKLSLKLSEKSMKNLKKYIDGIRNNEILPGYYTPEILLEKMEKGEEIEIKKKKEKKTEIPDEKDLAKEDTTVKDTEIEKKKRKTQFVERNYFEVKRNGDRVLIDRDVTEKTFHSFFINYYLNIIRRSTFLVPEEDINLFKRAQEKLKSEYNAKDYMVIIGAMAKYGNLSLLEAVKRYEENKIDENDIEDCIEYGITKCENIFGKKYDRYKTGTPDSILNLKQKDIEKLRKIYDKFEKNKSIITNIKSKDFRR